MKYKIPERFKTHNIVFWCILYKIILDISYMTIISKRFDYMGCVWNPDAIKYLESFFYLLTLISILPKKLNRYSTVFLHLELAIMLIPLLSFYSLANGNRIYMINILLSYCLQILILKINVSGICKRVKTLNWLVLLMCIIFGIAVLTMSIYANGVPTLAALNLENTYTIRAQIKMPYGLSYFTDWLCKIISPFFMIYFLSKKNYILSGCFCIISFVMFLIYSNKTYLFILPAIFFVYFLTANNAFIKGLYVSLAGGLLGTMMLYFFNNNLLMPVSMVARRFLIIPAMLKFRYYDFFSVNPKVHFADGRIGNLFHITSPYDSPIPIVIRRFYEGPNSSGSANTGYWGDAYANAGIWGVIFLSVLLAIMIKIIESITLNTPIEIVSATSIFTILSLNDVAFFTNILSGGMFILFILYFCFDLKAVYVRNTKKKDDEP